MPVIVIGNITVGGSGKTPLIIALVEYLHTKNIQVGVISRGYGGDTHQMPTLVTPQSTPAQVGDEPCLIVQNSDLTGRTVAMAVCPNRGQAIELLLKNNPAIQLILADDGLQHHALDRDKNWIVVDSDRGFGNRQVLPVGFLREPIKRLSSPDTTVIFHQKNWQVSPPLVKEDLGELSANLLMKLQEKPLQPLFLNHKVNVGQISDSVTRQKLEAILPPQSVIAMTGIGFPKRFFDSLKQLGFTLIEKPFNDHHNFSLSNFSDLPKDLPIVITAKDAVKIRLLLQADNSNFVQALRERIWVLPVVAVLSEEVWQALDRQIEELLT